MKVGVTRGTLVPPKTVTVDGVEVPVESYSREDVVVDDRIETVERIRVKGRAPHVVLEIEIVSTPPTPEAPPRRTAG